MKRIAITLLTTLLLSPSTTFSQTRNRSSRAKPSPAAEQTRVTQVRTAGAQKVANQIKLLTQFIYVLGKTTSSMAAVDDAVRRNEASPAVVQQNQQSKVVVKSSIAGYREGLDKLEIEFRTTPELQPYYIKLAGVAAGAVSAEEQGAAGQFDRAGRTLLDVINRLADVLVVMRQ